MLQHLHTIVHTQQILPAEPLLHEFVQAFIVDALTQVAPRPIAQPGTLTHLVQPDFRQCFLFRPIIGFSQHQRHIGITQHNPVVASIPVGAAFQIGILHGVIVSLPRLVRCPQERAADIARLE